MSTPTPATWRADIETFTRHLVCVPSISPSVAEGAVVEAVVALLRGDGLGDAYTHCGLVAIPNDPFGRHNAIAVLPGVTRDAVILLGHTDTVGITDFGELASLACDPEALAPHWRTLLGPDKTLANPEEWMFGRGALDMKSGVAVNIAVMRHFARQALAGAPPPFTIILAATPDEETQSAGAMALIGWLADYRAREGVRLRGLINTDYVAPRFAGDPERPIYSGTVGKLLPLFYVVGKATHVGDPYDGLDANLVSAELIHEFSMNPKLVDVVRGERTPPPVTLHSADLKASYNVQTPDTAWFYLNVLTLSTSPERLLADLMRRTARTMERISRKLVMDFEQLRGPAATVPQHLQPPEVWTFAQLAEMVIAAHGQAGLDATSAAVLAACPPQMDSREVTLRLIARLWETLGRAMPAVILAYAPPYYPHIAGENGPFLDAMRAVVARHAPAGVVLREFFPFLSDLSYMRLDPTMRTEGLRLNMPLWREEPQSAARPGYSLPIAAMRAAAIEGIVNIGVFGESGHQRDERVLMPYSFETVPQMVYETILELGAS
ncbi:MAG: M20/M25/M40 family metallo-hydrolase [Ktedonobacterales bacterium]|nr:M20/M25/M40 family metallo-hydrolase [Ktedonobacterales bacterium]